MVEGGMKCIKILLFAFNLIFVLCAIGLIAAGAYVQVQLKDYFDLIEGSFSSAAALLIAVGVIIFFIATFGCCGAYKENYMCTMIFAVLLGIIFILEIAGGIAGFVLHNKVEDVIDDYMHKSLRNDKPVWKDVQTEFKCCGVNNYMDWLNQTNHHGLEACCKDANNCHVTNTTAPIDPNELYPDGCLDKFGKWVKDKIYIVGAVGIALAFIQIVGVMFACCLARAIKKEYEVV